MVKAVPIEEFRSKFAKSKQIWQKPFIIELIELDSEELSSCINIPVPESKRLTLMDDYNMNYFNENESDCLETVLVPYGLKVLNTKHPTRVQGTSKSLIDYISSDHLQANTLQDIDHRVTSALTNLELKYCARVFNKLDNLTKRITITKFCLD